MSEPRATVAVVPRERFSCYKRAIQDLYAYTDVPFRAIVVDGGSPPRVKRWLEEEQRRRGFDLVRTERFLSPNAARNIALERMDTQYVVFMDNDVSVSPGWLGALLDCADETGAAVVGPLTCFGEPLGEVVHFAGGEVSVEEREGERHVKERMWHANRKVAKVADQLQRQPCTLAEFHCVLARREIFDRIGPFDEEMLNTREHLDFCLSVMQADGEVWVEPASVVTYVPGPPFAPSDLPYYMLRWSDDWERRSLERFRSKWALADDEFFHRRLTRLGRRRQTELLGRAMKRITPGGRGAWRLQKALAGPERRLNRMLVERYDPPRERTAA